MKEKKNMLLIRGGQIFLKGQMVDNAFIKIKEETIIEAGIWNRGMDETECDVIELAPAYKAAPGFIDVHIHGANNADTMDATAEALDRLAIVLPKEGTTSFLVTTITSSLEKSEKALANADEYIRNHQKKGNAEILGIHLEGPFINPKRAGAQPIEYIIPPDLPLLKKWLDIAGGHIRQVTLAPEQKDAYDLIHFLNEQKIIASIGHSDASYDEVLKAINSGVKSVTHLFNQMSGLHHREAGIVGAAFLHDELRAEIIADGLHISPEAVKLAYRAKGKEGLLLITDSMRAKHSGEGNFELGGQKVIVKDGLASLENGTLAGSVLKMDEAVRNMIEFTGCSLEEAITMAAVNPAEHLGLNMRKGSLSKGKDADVVILDEANNVVMTFCKGKLAFEKEGNKI